LKNKNKDNLIAKAKDDSSIAVIKADNSSVDNTVAFKLEDCVSGDTKNYFNTVNAVCFAADTEDLSASSSLGNTITAKNNGDNFTESLVKQSDFKVDEALDKTFKLIRLAKAGDEGAKTQLIEENSPLIKSVIRHYKNKGVDYDDLYQLGCVGFLKAVKNFCFDYCVRFSTYAVPMIAGEVKRFLRDDGFIKVSRSTKTLAVKINTFIERRKMESLAAPSVEDVAAEFGLTAYDVIFAMDAIKSPVSLYEKGGDDESAPELIDKVADKSNTDDNIDKIVLKDLIKNLSARDKLIINLRYFKDKTQSDVAKVLNVSQVQVSRLETKIINKIKSEFGAE